MTRLGQVFEYRVHNINKSSHSQVLEVLEQIRDGFLPFGKAFINYDVNMAESSELPCSIERIICDLSTSQPNQIFHFNTR